jgi:hypothetical protein
MYIAKKKMFTHFNKGHSRTNMKPIRHYESVELLQQTSLIHLYTVKIKIIINYMLLISHVTIK